MKANVDLDSAVCDSCGRSLFEFKGKRPPGHYSTWSASDVREFLMGSRCYYEGCEGRPLVAVEEA